MRKIGLLIAIGVTLSAGANAQRAANPQISKQVTTAFYNAVTHLKHRDVKSFMTMFTNDYTSRTLDGKVQNWFDTEREMKQMVEMAQSFDGASMKVESVRMLGYKAEVVSTMKLTVKVTDKDGSICGKKGDSHVIALQERSKETWVRTGAGGWRLASSVALSGSKTWLDGKPQPTMTARAPMTKPIAQKMQKTIQ